MSVFNFLLTFLTDSICVHLMSNVAYLLTSSPYALNLAERIRMSS